MSRTYREKGPHEGLEPAAVHHRVVRAPLGFQPGRRTLASARRLHKDVYRALNQAAGVACKTEGMRCNEAMSCPELTIRWNRFQNRIQARRTLMERCFRGGDVAHKGVLATYEKRQARCTEFSRIRCSPNEKCQ